MAVREFIRCPACGSLRDADVFGPGAGYEFALARQEIGGRGRCSWSFDPVPPDIAKQVRNRLHEAYFQVDGEIKMGGF